MKPRKLAGNTVVPKWNWTREFSAYYATWLRAQLKYQYYSPLSDRRETPLERQARLYSVWKTGIKTAAVSCG